MHKMKWIEKQYKFLWKTQIIKQINPLSLVFDTKYVILCFKGRCPNQNAPPFLCLISAIFC